MSTLDAFGFHTQKHAPQQQHAPQSKGESAQQRVKSIAFDAGTVDASSSTPSSYKHSALHQQHQAVPWLITTVTTRTRQSTLPLAMTKTPKKCGKGPTARPVAATKKPVTGPITRYFTAKQQDASMEIDADQRRVRKQLSFQELWQRMVQEYSQHRNKNEDDDCNLLKQSSRRRKHDDDSDDNINNDEECCAVAVTKSTLRQGRQATKKTKITVDHEFLLKFQQLLTVNNPPLYKIPLVENKDEEQEQQQIVVVTVRRQLTADESIAFLKQIADELLL
ncbi:hypothetical protein BDB00DRAFT_795329 [Zychaea mexicana]|uniref:uncharacterized protein n=1 Tax=Zychaea mexicana TaxID=64656 RepID=UPI0022FF3633|nr:uncharacterized protein BDB00DRAFT_795329 [Zychaea mexicana]KAI9499728.1 hypothetical protein BDB00DRAFT_795329 [Zychaea mexicana]